MNGLNVLTGKNILIVDDNPQNTFALSSYLGSKEMNVFTAENGFEAIAFLQNNKHKVHIVLMDIMMPEMDGFEAIRKIKSNADIEKTLIIAVTARAMKGDREKCLDAGADEYVSKPVDVMELQHKMVELLNA